MTSSWRLLLLGVGLAAIVVGTCVLTKQDASRADDPSPASTSPNRSRRPGEVGARPVDRAGAADTIRGQVVDEDGQPVEEGRLLFTCQATGRPLPGAPPLAVDGRFEAAGCGGPVCAQLQHPSLIQDDAWVLVPGEPALLRARPLQALLGHVLDSGGSPVAGAKVVLVPEEDDPTAVDVFAARHATSDEHGDFAYMRVERPPCDACGEQAGRCERGVAEALPVFAGGLVLSVSAAGFRVAETTIDAATEGPLEVRLEAPAEPLTGTVLDAHGRAYARARVLLRSHERRSERHGIASDPGDGSFAFLDLGDGGYELQVIQDGVELLARDGVRAGELLELRGAPASDGARLELHVVRADGGGVEGAVVDGGPFHAAHTDADGRVVATGVVRGEYRIRVGGPAGATVRERVVVPEGVDAHEVEIELPAG